MSAKGLPPSAGKNALESWLQGERFEAEGSIYDIDHEPSLEPGLSSLQSALEELKKTYPRAASNTHQGNEFDRYACVEVHRHLRIGPAVAGSRDFWIWLTTVHFRDLVRWRHDAGDGNINLSNFGIENKFDGLLCRLWYRADLVIDVGHDPYHLARRGPHRDFWQSGLLRKRYGSCRSFAKAFVKFQYPDRKSDRARLDPHTNDGVRGAYRDIQALQATVELEFLDESEALALLEEIAATRKPSKALKDAGESRG